MKEFFESGIIAPHALYQEIQRHSPHLKVIDATYGATPEHYIEDALPFDIDAIADQENPLPHTLPSPKEFAVAMTQMGISSEDNIIVYDASGIAMAAARAWWMFRVFGHDKVCVLDGGLPAWVAAGYPVTGKPAKPVPAETNNFSENFCQALVKNKNDILDLLESNQAGHIIDARAAGRFHGLMPEPRPGMRSGHIPGSRNLPFMDLLDPHTGGLKEKEELQTLLSPLTPQDPPLVTTCGSGVTACVLALGLFRVGQKDVAVYDGSWSEWGRIAENSPVACTT